MTTDELRALALAATPGPWHAVTHDPDDSPGEVYGSDDREICDSYSKNYRSDAAYIAAASPHRVLALLDDNARLRAALTEIERRLRVDAAPLIPIIKEHGGPAERRAWKAVYSSAIHAQGALREHDAALGSKP